MISWDSPTQEFHPWMVIYFTPSIQMISFRNLYFEQGIAYVIKFIQVLRTPGQPDTFLQISLRWWQALCDPDAVRQRAADERQFEIVLKEDL